MMKKNIRITCAQISSETNDKKANIEKIKCFIDKSILQYPDTDLILFPELALSGCECSPAQIEKIAETVDGPSIKEIAEYGAQKNVFIAFGFLEKDRQTNSIYNSAVLTSNKGDILGQYRKMHLVEEEKSLVEKGNSTYPVFDTEIGRIGMMICWDSAFPEVARILAIKGADYILIPAAWEAPMQNDWDLVQRARAFDNVIFTACCNQVGKDITLDFFGRSKISGPNGEVLSDVIDNKEGIVSARFNIEDKKTLRDGYYALLRDRRPESYEELLHHYQERT